PAHAAAREPARRVAARRARRRVEHLPAAARGPGHGRGPRPRPARLRAGLARDRHLAPGMWIRCWTQWRWCWWYGRCDAAALWPVFSPPGRRAEPRQCHIAVVRTTTE